MIDYLASTFLTAIAWIGGISVIGTIVLIACICDAHDDVGHQFDDDRGND